MDISSYIFDLLQQRKEVGLTNLGTFYKKKYPGRYDKETQSFLPPAYALQFTTEVKLDQELAEFISTKKNISNESADYYISKFVEETKQKLETDHEAELENLGRLFFTEHEGLSFEPAKNINYGSEFYGLPALTETSLPETSAEVASEEENVFEEITEVNTTNTTTNQVEEKHLVIETIELDEVQDDLRNTLQHTEQSEVQHDVPDFIKEQHAEHPNRFGHTPEDEEAVKAITHPEVEVPESVVAQHEDHPNRFGHTPETEAPKTYLHLEEEKPKAETVTQAPVFIKEQHAEHPHRFGHDPIENEPETPKQKSIWLLILIAAAILLLIAITLYFVKPELFNKQAAVTQAPQPTAIDTSKLTTDSTKAKQDSIAKTDSILKANQVGVMKTTDTAKAKPTAIGQVVASGKPMFHVIAVSYKTEAAALEYIKRVKKIGLNATIANMEGSRKKVSIASFETKDEAEKQKDILQKRLKGEGFYVKEIKNNTQP